jgi:diaminopimelate epimerase
VATAVVGLDRARLKPPNITFLRSHNLTTDLFVNKSLRDIPFIKMTGSGNDFVFFDGRTVDVALLSQADVIQAICHRRNGIGADGLVVLVPTAGADAAIARPPVHETTDAQILYFNSDGTPADLCGNATLCSTALAAQLGLADPRGMRLATPSGTIASRVVGLLPEIAVPPVTVVEPSAAVDVVEGEQRVGFAIVGIPHLVILCDDAEAVDVAGRGPSLRWHPAGGSTGANVNWVSARSDGTWRYRTFERGVEGETLACGTGALATAILLQRWGLSGDATRIITSSGRALDVTLQGSEGAIHPSLRGEGRVVFSGTIGDLGD